MLDTQVVRFWMTYNRTAITITAWPSVPPNTSMEFCPTLRGPPAALPFAGGSPPLPPGLGGSASMLQYKTFFFGINKKQKTVIVINTSHEADVHYKVHNISESLCNCLSVLDLNFFPATSESYWLQDYDELWPLLQRHSLIRHQDLRLQL